MRLIFNRSKFVVFHALFWIGVWFFYVYFFSYNAQNSNYVTWFSSFLLPVTMITTYFSVYFLIPKYLLEKRYWKLFLYALYTLIFSTYLIVLSILGSFVFLSNFNLDSMPPMSRNYVFVLILVYLVVAVVSFISLLSHSFKTLAKNKLLENKILETQLTSKEQELSFLKKQIHPHFLFNTLNTIYGFALRKSDDTPEVILKLSNLLDYILYQVDKPNVALTEEVLHIKEYIELEKIRFQDTLSIAFNISDIPSEFQVAPMLLIPFVENAFKHGDLLEGMLDVRLDLKVIDDCLEFNILNTVLEDNTTKIDRGLGLKNIRQRLDLVYANNYELNIQHQKKVFSVHLVIRDLNKKKDA